MKKFTCLLVALLAVHSVTPTCAGTATDTNSLTTFMVATTTPAIVGQIAAADFANTGTTATGYCGAATNGHCIGTPATNVPKVSTWLDNRLKKVADAFGTFATNFVNIGKRLAKVVGVQTGIDSAVFSAVSAGTIGGFTGAQMEPFVKKWATAADVQTAWTAYRDGAVACYNIINALYQVAVCDATSDANFANWAGTAIHSTSIGITTASAAAITVACGKVWGFMLRSSMLAMGAAYYTKTKSGAGGSFTIPTALTFDTKASVTAADIITWDACVADPTATATCTGTISDSFVKGMLMPFGDNPLAFVSVTATAANSPFVEASATSAFGAAARRQLAATTANTLAIAISSAAGALAVTSTTSTTQIAAAATVTAVFTSTTTSSWSSGYVAPGSGSSSGSSSGSNSSNKSSANVLIGSILSFLAIALLN